MLALAGGRELVGGYDQQTLDTVEAAGERGRLVEVDPADLNVARKSRSEQLGRRVPAMMWRPEPTSSDTTSRPSAPPAPVTTIEPWSFI